MVSVSWMNITIGDVGTFEIISYFSWKLTSTSDLSPALRNE